jgi:hypothetical protein
MSGINIIFYSRECGACKNLLNALATEDLLKMFKLYCVDGRLNTVPACIKAVPALIVENINKPLVAQEAFEWVQKMKFIKQSIAKNSNNNKTRDPVGFAQLEMGGLSDQFAYKDVDKAMVHSYCDVSNNNTIFTAPEQDKLKEQDQLAKIQNLEKLRTEQNSHYSKIMREQQLKALDGSA